MIKIIILLLIGFFTFSHCHQRKGHEPDVYYDIPASNENIEQNSDAGFQWDEPIRVKPDQREWVEPSDTNWEEIISDEEKLNTDDISNEENQDNWEEASPIDTPSEYEYMNSNDEISNQESVPEDDEEQIYNDYPEQPVDNYPEQPMNDYQEQSVNDYPEQSVDNEQEQSVNDYQEQPEQNSDYLPEPKKLEQPIENIDDNSEYNIEQVYDDTDPVEDIENDFDNDEVLHADKDLITTDSSSEENQESNEDMPDNVEIYEPYLERKYSSEEESQSNSNSQSKEFSRDNEDEYADLWPNSDEKEIDENVQGEYNSDVDNADNWNNNRYTTIRYAEDIPVAQAKVLSSEFDESKSDGRKGPFTPWHYTMFGVAGGVFILAFVVIVAALIRVIHGRIPYTRLETRHASNV